MEEEYVITVDENDQVTGSKEKYRAHADGDLHRAISVFIFNSKKEILLQQRAKNKYHSGGLWTNTCCSHPRPNEETKSAAVRRLKEEMGIELNNLRFAFSFKYKVALDNDLIEHEYDHVYFGISDASPIPNYLEIAGWKYLPVEQIETELKEQPENYTYWFKLIWKDILIKAKELGYL